MSNDKLNSEKLRQALNNGLKGEEKNKDSSQEDVVLTDTDLDDVAGGLASCGAMCGTFG